MHTTTKISALTPVEKRDGLFFKRDDAFVVNGVRGGKVRACLQLAQGAKALVCASSRFSPQVSIVARVAESLGIPARVHMPEGDETPTMKDGIVHGAKIIRHSPGYKSVIVARAREDAEKNEKKGCRLIPWGMESTAQVDGTAAQVGNIPKEAKRVVVPVAYAISLAGVLQGMAKNKINKPVLGVCVSSDPSERLDKWAPKGWRDMVELVQSPLEYHELPQERSVCGIDLDPVYEAKCVPFLKKGDLFWIIGIRPAGTA